MLVKVCQSGGIIGLIRSKEIESDDIKDRWNEFVNKTTFMSIAKGTTLKNYSDVNEIKGRDMFSYSVEADERTIIFNTGVKMDDPFFNEVRNFVEYVLKK